VVDSIGHVPPEPMRRIEEAIRRYRGDATEGQGQPETP
jgi:hypothetical protein